MSDFSNLLNPIVTGIKPSGIRKFFDLAAEMDGVISLGVGEPDFQTPWHIRQAGIASLERGRTKYTANRGLAELRGEISQYLSRRFGLDYSSDEIVVTVGGSEAIDLTMRAFICPGDEVLIPQPCFVCYEPLARICGAKPVIMECTEEDGFKLTPELLRSHITPKSKLLVLPYPNNPTGAVMTAYELEAIADILRGTNIAVLSDEIYSELTFEGRHTSIASLPGMRERTVVVNGFSKSFAMTGWRLGYAAAPKAISDQLTKLHQFAIMSAPTTAQYAAIEGLRNGDADIEEMKNQYAMRQRLVVGTLRSMGMPTANPGGAFYVFPNISGFGLDGDEFCERLLREQKVAIVPGSAFGECGAGYARISCSYSINHLSDALGRIECFIKTL